MLEDDDLELDTSNKETKPFNRKKVLVLILPLVIVIGLSAGLFYVFNNNYESESTGNYSIITKPSADKNTADAVTVFYDLPEITAMLKTPDSFGKEHLRVRLNLELNRIEDIKNIEALTPKITDAVIAHTIELMPQEVTGSGGLYWLKEELLYRINLITNPIKVSNINFRTFEIANNDKSNK